MIFVGRAVAEERDFYNCKNITCEGALAFLNDSVASEGEFNNISVADFIIMLIENHNKQVSEKQKIYINSIDNFGLINAEIGTGETTYSALEKNVFNHTEGNIAFSYISDKLSLSYKKTKQIDCNIIEYGVNLTDLNIKFDVGSLFTGVIPTGKDSNSEPVTIKGVNSNSDIVFNDSLVLKYGIIIKQIDYGTVTDSSELLSKATNELQNQTINKEIKAKVIDSALYQVYGGYICSGELYRLKSDRHGIDIFVRCSEKKTDLLNEANSYAMFGERKSLTKTF